jgi:hypothetical protein
MTNSSCGNFRLQTDAAPQRSIEHTVGLTPAFLQFNLFPHSELSTVSGILPKFTSRAPNPIMYKNSVLGWCTHQPVWFRWLMWYRAPRSDAMYTENGSVHLPRNIKLDIANTRLNFCRSSKMSGLGICCIQCIDRIGYPKATERYTSSWPTKEANPLGSHSPPNTHPSASA